MLDGITITHLNPISAQYMANEIPAFPLVASTTVPPLDNKPFSTARVKMFLIGLSLTEPDGFINSALPQIITPSISIGISGV